MPYQPTLYRSLKSQLEDLKADIQAQKSTQELTRSHLQIEDFFQSQILDGSSTDEAGDATETPTEEEDLVSYYVEINKQLRLLGADLTMLQAARNPNTIAQRMQQSITRLDMLSGYCDRLLELHQSSDA